MESRIYIDKISCYNEEKCKKQEFGKWTDVNMGINKAKRALIKALSFDEIDVEVSRNIADLKRIDLMKGFYKTVDTRVRNGEHLVPVRLFYPESADKNRNPEGNKLLVFFHGGGWVTDHIDNYERICDKMATFTNYVVAAVEYRLAPEHKFPCGLEDCYAVAKAIYDGTFLLKVKWEDVAFIGDSAGGNLVAALSLMARDRGEFLPKKQILLYPALYNEYSERSPFASVVENGSDYILTMGKMSDYLELYQKSEEDRKNPYFAPYIAEELSNQPDTLILTAEYCMLRDEGEAYGRRLMESGNKVQVHRIKDALHGFFALGINGSFTLESLEYINRFLEEGL